MFNKNFLKIFGLAVALLSSSAQAMTLDFTGGYRFEWTGISKPSLGSPAGDKSYGLNYLYLAPKIIAADGVNIISRFDVLNTGGYPNSYLGQIWGMNVPNSGTSTANGETGGVAYLKMSQLYLSVDQEYGALLVGRVPFEFGLGMKYNAGRGLFDHWYDTRDMAAYKVVLGDWFIMPMVGRIQSSGFYQGDTITFEGAQAQYENKETKSLIGFLEEIRQSSGTSNDLDATAFGADPNAGRTGISMQSTNFVLGRGFDNFGFKLEAGFQSGNTGLVDVNGNNIKFGGYGVAVELYFPHPESKWDWTLKFGMASGENPNSTTYGAYQFNRNYDVGLLLFNHRLGQLDFFNTNAIKNPNGSVNNTADDEAIGNATYLAPTVGYIFNDHFTLVNTLLYAQLMQVQNSSIDSKKDLGLEWDISLIYKPLERVQWINQVGVLLPGAAWKNGDGPTGNLPNGLALGYVTKAAISF